MSMVTFDTVVEILRPPMLNAREDGAQGRRIALRLVRRDSLRPHARLVDRMLEEPLRCLGVAPLRKVCIDHLAILIDSAIDIRPAPLQTNIGLIDAPFCADWSAMGTRSFPEQRQEALDPTRYSVC
jgi:hypothetical protein